MATSPPRAQIISAQESDLPALSHLAEVIWKACYPGIISMDQIEYMLGQMYSQDTLLREIRAGVRFDKLMVDNSFSGFSSYGPTDRADTFKLHKLYLLPRLHGFGLGSAMLSRCESEVRLRGARRLILNVNKQNIKAVTAYKRNGFAVVESVMADIGRGFVMDDFVMAKDL